MSILMTLPLDRSSFRKDRRHCPIIVCTIHHQNEASSSYPSECYNLRAGHIYHPIPSPFSGQHYTTKFKVEVVEWLRTLACQTFQHSQELQLQFFPLYDFVLLLYCYCCILAK